jgi:hypothetical protein
MPSNERDDSETPVLRENFVSYGGLEAQAHTEEDSHLQKELIRTQIHLSEQQRAFLTEQAKLTGLSMAAQIRNLIDIQMNPKTTDWDHNPLLEDTVVDPSFQGSSDASVTSDSLIYGSYEE